MFGHRAAHSAMPSHELQHELQHAIAGDVSIANITRVSVSRSLRDCEAWWPRSGARGDASCYAFQYADVLDVWCDTLGAANQIEPAFVTVFDASGKPALLLPLGIEERNGVRMLRFLDGGVSDYNAPVVFPEAADWGPEAASALWSLLRRKLPPFDLAMLEKMPDAVGDLRNPLSGLATAPHAESCHVARLEGSWERFARGHIKKPSDSRRRRRNLEKLGTLRFAVAANAAERADFVAAMMRMKRDKFIETKGYDVFTDPGFGDFYREATRRLGADGPVHLSALLLDDRILAAHWGYIADDRFYHLMPAHESGEWRSYAPGRLLNEWLLQWACESGLKDFDFGIGDEPYKSDYCDVNVPLRDAILPVNAKGRLAAAMLEVKRNAKRSLRESPLAPAILATRNFWRGLRK
jgi:CelD/BcsL family acetyltransferase involved in cellulose biosynthesis